MAEPTGDEQRLALAQAYRDVLASPAGGIVLADLDRLFGGNPFDATSDRMTSYRCGALAVIAHIIEQAQAATVQEQMPRQETTNG